MLGIVLEGAGDSGAAPLVLLRLHRALLSLGKSGIIHDGRPPAAGASKAGGKAAASSASIPAAGIRVLNIGHALRAVPCCAALCHAASTVCC